MWVKYVQQYINNMSFVGVCDCSAQLHEIDAISVLVTRKYLNIISGYFLTDHLKTRLA